MSNKTNEELALEIQNGKTESMVELWEQVQNLVRVNAVHVLRCLNSRGSCDMDDLMQAGYLGVVAAVQAYQPECGYAFTTWLRYPLMNEFAVASSYRTKRQRMDPVQTAMHLEAPVVQKDGDTTTVADLVPAPTAEDDPSQDAEMAEAETEIFNEELHNALESVLADLPPDVREVIKQRYYENKEYVRVADCLGMDINRVRSLDLKGIRELRNPRVTKKLRPFIDFNCYTATGLQAFRTSGMSVQERYLIRQEQECRHGKG